MSVKFEIPYFTVSGVTVRPGFRKGISKRSYLKMFRTCATTQPQTHSMSSGISRLLRSLATRHGHCESSGQSKNHGKTMVKDL